MWRRLGRVYEPAHSHPLLHSHAALPVGVPLGGEHVRVFYCGRDQANRSSIATLVLRLGEPPRVEEVALAPVLEPGSAGTFDDAGLGIGSIVPAPDGDRLYYMGWNLGRSVPWRNAIGVAIGDARQGRFKRLSAGPIMDRDITDHFSLSYPWVVRQSPDRWDMWYGTHLTWGHSSADMSHAIRKATSRDGLSWTRSPELSVRPRPNEIAVVRPSVIVGRDGATMIFACRGHGPYRLGLAHSTDLKTWSRLESPVLAPEPGGWEGEALTYPSLFEALNRRWLLYNGSGYGASGFGLAVWEE